jgi:hypothetical protein
MGTRILDAKETRLKAQEIIEAELTQKFPRMHPQQRRILAKKLTKKTMQQFRGQKIMLTTRPKSRWQAFKLKHAPKWFLQKYPVQYVET